MLCETPKSTHNFLFLPFTIFRVSYRMKRGGGGGCIGLENHISMQRDESMKDFDKFVFTSAGTWSLSNIDEMKSLFKFHQVYKGLDIITNKVTQEQQDGIPHHLLGMVSPLSRFTVVDFRDQAVPLINELRRSQKMPVIVGGTNYYIEALLWKVLVEQSVSSCQILEICQISMN